MKKTGAPRQASLHRATKETDIRVDWSLDGTGQGTVDTSIRFFDHMLDLLAKHGFFDLTVQAKGDIEIDEHHTVEDVGIVMGKVKRRGSSDSDSPRSHWMKPSRR